MIGSQNVLKLQITGPDGSTKESRCEKESVVIGSGAAAEVLLADAAVSSLHLMLKWDGAGGVTAIDLGSERGTRLGDQLMRAPVPVSSGDVLELGGTRLEVLFGKDLQEVPALPSTMSSETLSFNRPLPLNRSPTEQSRVLQVAMLWGDTAIDVQHFGDGVPVTIGESERNCFQVFSPILVHRFRLAAANGSTITANVPSGARVDVSSPGGKQTSHVRPLEPPSAGNSPRQTETIQAQLHDRLRISLGQVSFVLRFVRPLPGVKIQVLEETDVGFLRIAAVCAMACILLIVGLVIGSKPRLLSDGGMPQMPAHYARFLIRPEVKKKAAKKEDIGLPEGAKAKEEEGKFGLKNAKKEEADPSRPGSPIVDPRRQEADRKKVMTAGLLGAWGKAPDASNLLGPGGFGTGINDALGGLKAGAGLADAKGIGGLGSRGRGIGGGGAALGLGG